MLVSGKVARSLLAACAVAVLAGCTSGDSGDPAPPSTEAGFDVATVRNALLQAKDVGATWKAPERSAPPTALVALCGGDAPAPPTPGSPTVTTAALVDEGEGGAQTLDQVGLVYDGATAATAGLQALRAAAAACPPTVKKPSQVGGNSRVVGYAETVTTSALNPTGWTGFVVVRHRTYEATKPAIGDTAVAVLSNRNTVLVISYAIYRLGAQTTGPQFTSDWQRLVGSVLKRMGG